MEDLNLHTKDHLLKNKITYYQYKNGYRTGIEPIILASKVNISANKILDIGCGCGSISLILAYRNKKSYIYGWDKNKDYLLLANKNKLENNFNNLIYENLDITKFNSSYKNFFDIILTNPPFFLDDSVLKSKNKLLQDARYISFIKLNEWIKNMLDYLKNNGTAFLINRYSNLDLLMKILNNYKIKINVQYIKSYADSEPKNLIIEIKKSDNYSLTVISDLIVHDRDSNDGYSKDLKEWME
ncbi:methyltransferase domain-containing protein [Alphaproteobacteria bacterium]|nr:methyltransferase domain-containing protein [Alphaproteobacteria bacterium]